MNIGEKVITEIKDQIEGLLYDYESKLNEAYLKAGDGISLSFGVSVSPSKKNSEGIDVESKLSFTLEKVTAKSEPKTVNEVQRDMFTE